MTEPIIIKLIEFVGGAGILIAAAFLIKTFGEAWAKKPKTNSSSNTTGVNSEKLDNLATLLKELENNHLKEMQNAILARINDLILKMDKMIDLNEKQVRYMEMNEKLMWPVFRKITGAGKDS